ncbi:MAG: SDR family NAD(P)-dependent oxidoreductase [Candidatus Puniceispirillaceae bacterium]
MTKVAIITGGSRGIGRAIVTHLHQQGYQIITNGRGTRPANLPDDIIWIQADISKTADAALVCDAARQSFGRIDVLVNNAGTQVEKTVAQSDDDDWDLVINTNCKGVFNMCREALKDMSDTGGNIINIGSISGVVSDPSMALYNASKAFVHGLTRSIAVDHGPHVRCNAIRPGWIMTQMAEDGFALANDPEKAMADALARHPVGRFGKPEDIAKMVAWLASDDSAYVSGECITVDGGMTAASPLNPGLF